ncbi:unnamed protein product [Plutella xylostella]|uniref:(diamondback moth) hypothetical protein n=1 Tax=Plutella xylostella TaxID=51655 RepID=A0A8S4G8M3_PLUXY|nr:unnamed protein product [Plutella xylostella]
MIDKKKKKNKDNETEEDFEDRISFFQIFRYGKWYELLATVVGVVFGMASGFGICFNLVTFGEITTALVCRTTYYEVTSSRLPVLEYFGGGRQLTNASYEENMAALIEDGEALLLSMVFSIGLSWVLVILAVWLVNWSALKQITRIRSMFLRSVLRQDMYWYDTDTSFNLASRMSE